ALRGNSHTLYGLQDLPKVRPWGSTHGSICVQEGQPLDLIRPFSKSHQNTNNQLGGQLGIFVPVSSLRIAFSASAGSRCRQCASRIEGASAGLSTWRYLCGAAAVAK